MTDKDVLEFLVRAAAESGDAIVERAIKRFRNPKQRAVAEGITPTKRKAIPKKWTLAAWERQKGYCVWCGAPIEERELSGDHRDPISTGGAHNAASIDAVHLTCNSSKGNRSGSINQKRARMSFYEQELIRAGKYPEEA